MLFIPGKRFREEEGKKKSNFVQPFLRGLPFATQPPSNPGWNVSGPVSRNDPEFCGGEEQRAQQVKANSGTLEWIVDLVSVECSPFNGTESRLTVSRRGFLKPNGRPHREGERLPSSCVHQDGVFSWAG